MDVQVDLETDAQRIALRLNALLAGAGMSPLDDAVSERFGEYCALLMRWNARVNLTAIRDEDGVLTRHFVESIACARALPEGIGSLLDFGSGAGFPGIPIALCRPEIQVTLAESRGKKAAFLQEAVRVLGVHSKVHTGRAETLTERFDCVTMRAVERMTEAVRAAGALVKDAGWLVAMTTRGELESVQAAAGAEFQWREAVGLPGGDDRVVALGQRSANSPV